MRVLLAAFVWGAMTTSALAQHDHGSHEPPADAVSSHAEHLGHGAAPANNHDQATPAKQPDSGHEHESPPAVPSQPIKPPAPAEGSQHDGHGMHHQPKPGSQSESLRQDDGHAHQAHASEGLDVRSGPAPSEATAGPEHAADSVFGASNMEASRGELHRMHGGSRAYKVTIDRLEGRVRGGRDAVLWDAQAWYGGDIDKLWVKTEGEGQLSGGVESAEIQALWSRAVSPWFNFQAGVRHDFRPDPERTHLVLGLQGLAPYWIEVDAALFLSDKGDMTGRLEAEYDLRITQRLILQPRAELEFSAQKVPELGLGSGITKAEVGMRLRYEILPEFAPYVGIEYERALGDTAELKRLGGEEAGDWFLTIGVRTWF